MAKHSNKIRDKQHEEFRNALGNLNPAQQEAVEKIEGPVLVIAGPGTGKTHILGARIGQILMQTDTLPHNILCLTYTDSGVHAMRKRLLQFIGPEAHRVHINTFHSFCNNIVQDNLPLFGLRELEPITDLEKLELVGELLDELPSDHILKNLKGERKIYDKKLIDLFDRMKAESWSLDYIEEKIEEYFISIPSREEFIYKRKQGQFQKGDLKAGTIAKVKQKLEQLRAGAKLYDRFQAKMRENKRYEFADMLLWVIQVFKENPEVLLSYQEQYLYFLVDEFQDTNGTQNQLLKMLIQYWDRPNIFVVGDDDQSIYEFQGARVKNLIEFFEEYSVETKPIVLKENYRSSQQLLDSAKTLIDQNELRLINRMDAGEINKDLIAAHEKFSKGELKPQIVGYPNNIHEVADIVMQIEELRRQEVSLNDVAIIYAKHKQGRDLIKLLNKKEIPYQTKRRINILELTIIKQVLTIFDYLQAEFERPDSGEELLYELLHYDFFEINPNDITRMAIYKARNPEAKAWRELIDDVVMSKILMLAQPERFVAVSDFLIRMKGAFANYSLPQLYERIINRSGLLHFSTQGEDRVWNIQVLTTFLKFIQEETDKNDNFHVPQLLDTIARMRENHLEMGLSKTVYSKDGGVLLTSAHSSKGLEFRYVFMLDCGEEWEPRTRISARRFSFPETLTLSGPEDGMEASRRLFYVAMTRAQEFLQISYSKHNNKGKAIKHARYVDEIATSPSVEILERFVPPFEVAEAQFLLLSENKQPEIGQKLAKEEVDELLEGFSLSPTSLSRYLACPLSFYYENILKLPSTSSEAASYGTAAHNALKWAFDKMKESEEKVFPATSQFMKVFRREMAYQRAHLSKAQYQRRIDLGELRLPVYYDLRVPTWHKQVELERDFRNVEWNGIPLTGTVDKIEFLKKSALHIVDYKTGAPRSASYGRPQRKGHKGGDYWRQLVFYKILLENFRNYDWEILSGEIDYLEKDKVSGEYPSIRIDFTPEDVKIVGEQIKTAYNGIMAHDFYKGCGKPNCKWCNFTTHYAKVDSFRDKLAEELDD